MTLLLLVGARGWNLVMKNELLLVMGFRILFDTVVVRSEELRYFPSPLDYPGCSYERGYT